MASQISDLQSRMLEAGEFHLDGWTNPNSLSAASELVEKGFLTMTVGGSDEEQYTAYNFTITNEGKDLLRRLKER